jgi:hypothetical protein
MVEHHCDKEKEIGMILQNLQDISKELGELKSEVKEVKKAIYGNGRPGLRQEMDQIRGGLKLLSFLLASSVVGNVVFLIKNFVLS